jgi:hypothetical protein
VSNGLAAKKNSVRGEPSALTLSLAACLPVVTLLWTIPIDLVRANRWDLGNSYSLLLPYVGLAFILLFAFTFLFRRMRRGAHITALCFSGVGVFFLLLEIFAPGGISQSASEFVLEKGALLRVGPPALTASIICAVFLAYFGIASVVRACALMSITLAITSGAALLRDILVLAPKVSSMKSALAPHARATTPNVYHFILDAFSSDEFPRALERAGDKNHFQGFSFFEKTYSNFTRTQESLPSLLTGTLPTWNAMQAWGNSPRERGIFSEFFSRGYKVSAYAPIESELFPNAYIRKSFWSAPKSRDGALTALFTDLWLARSFSFLLPPDFMKKGLGPVSKFWRRHTGADVPSTSLRSRLLLDDVAQDEEARGAQGEYVFVHVLLPHSPYDLNADCSEAPGEAEYSDQSVCTLKLVGKFLARLKELGRFDSSIIIVQSDHGEYFERPDFSPRMSETESLEFQKRNIYGFTGHDLERRVQALLLIKPANSGDIPLRTSNTRAQLLDIPATIYGLLRWPMVTEQGLDLFSEQASTPRSINFFDGFIIHPNGGPLQRFGEQYFEGEINHYSIANDGTWSELPRVKVVW